MFEKIIVVFPSVNRYVFDEEYLFDIDISQLCRYNNSQLLLFFITQLVEQYALEIHDNICEKYQLVEENSSGKRIFKIKNMEVIEMREDISRLVKIIENLKVLIHQAESRKLEFVQANNSLNHNIYVDEVANNKIRITKLEDSISEQNHKLFSKREELFYLIFNERGNLESFASRIEEKLPEFSSDKLDEFLSQIYQLHTSLEQRNLPIPSELAEVQSTAGKQDVPDDEKRFKVKMIIGILPRMEIEKEFVDPKLGDIWKSFCKKAKEIASIKVF